MGEPKTERPILFSAPMVRAILAGRKTQTRRVIPDATGEFWDHRGWSPRQIDAERIEWAAGEHVHAMQKRCPYGEPGHTLCVREPLRPATAYRIGEDHGVGGYDAVSYDADGTILEDATWCPYPWPWRTRYIASRYCPRWASRITLPVLSVRVERLQSISEEDARAEGVDPRGAVEYAEAGAASYYEAFRTLWDSINGKRPGCSWDANPWVWCVGFGPPEARP